MADVDAFLAELRALVETARRHARAVAVSPVRIDAQFPGRLDRRARRRLARGFPLAGRN